MERETCPLCGGPAQIETPRYPMRHFRCERCREFALSARRERFIRERDESVRKGLAAAARECGAAEDHLLLITVHEVGGQIEIHQECTTWNAVFRPT